MMVPGGAGVQPVLGWTADLLLFPADAAGSGVGGSLLRCGGEGISDDFGKRFERVKNAFPAT